MSDEPDNHKEEDEFSGVFDNAPTTPSEPYRQQLSDDHGAAAPAVA